VSANRVARAWALLPLALFTAYLALAASEERAWDALWICHVANLLLAAGIALARPRWVRAAAVLLAPAFPLWIYDMVEAGKVDLVSVASHVGGLVIALVATWHMPTGARAWPVALATFLAAQAAARLFAPAALNVNIAHGIYPGWDRWFSSHAAYWAFTTTVAALLLWLADRLLPRSAHSRLEAAPS
jgi:hypothetical protein